VRYPILGIRLAIHLRGLDILVLVPEVRGGDGRNGAGRFVADGDFWEEGAVEKVRILASNRVEAQMRPDNVC